MLPTCKTCVFYREGKCYRYPPGFCYHGNNGTIRSTLVQPSVYSSGYCGEHKED